MPWTANRARRWSRRWAATSKGSPRSQRAVGSRRVGRLSTSARRSTDEGSLIRAEWLDSHRLPAAPARPTRIVVAVDPADSGQGDETGIIAGSLAPDGTVCLIADVQRATDLGCVGEPGRGAGDHPGREFDRRGGFLGGHDLHSAGHRGAARPAAPHHVTVSSWPPKGRARVGDALARSAGMLAALENGAA